MKYYVSVAVDGRIDIEVEANSFDEAKSKAEIEVIDKNFGALSDIEWSCVNAESETGEFKDFD